MACKHQTGGLQISVYRAGEWYSRCIICGDEAAVTAPGLPSEAGAAAEKAMRLFALQRFGEAAAALRSAYDLSQDARYLFHSLLCRLGVDWCGDEYQPTFGADDLPMEPLTDSPEWRTIDQAAGSLSVQVFQSMQAVLTQLEEILGHLRANEGLRGCDVFICYRRSDAAVRAALSLYRSLTDAGLRVFCADVTTNGKTQEQFESEVWHALQTAEHLVLIPGEGEEELTPWLRNELARARCSKDHRMVCTDGLDSLPAAISGVGACKSMEEIRQTLFLAASACTAERLAERALEALQTPESAPEALAMLRRASARGHQEARLLLSCLYDEGLALPQDAARAALYRRLAGAVPDTLLQRVNAAMNAIEQRLGVTRRQALIYLIADVSDASVRSSRMLMRPLFTTLTTDRRLSASQLCVVGYDRHAQVLEEPKALDKYGLPENAVKALHTSTGGGRDRVAYAAKGLRCAADHLHQTRTGGCAPCFVLLRPCLTSDAESSIAAAAAILEAASDAPVHEIHSIEQLPACISALRSLL